MPIHLSIRSQRFIQRFKEMNKTTHNPEITTNEFGNTYFEQKPQYKLDFHLWRHIKSFLFLKTNKNIYSLKYVKNTKRKNVNNYIAYSPDNQYFAYLNNLNKPNQNQMN